jgi:hypothetical protein
MNAALLRLVWRRAHGVCEYCRLAQTYSHLPFQPDHIIAKKHGGKTTASNLALSCYFCNSYKGPNISGIDPLTKALVRLFHPRRHKWHYHFRWDGPMLIGRTPIGRATIAVLVINDPEAVATRQLLLASGLFPPRV